MTTRSWWTGSVTQSKLCVVIMLKHILITTYILRHNASSCSGVRSDDYEKLVDREVRASIQRMQAAEDSKQQGLRTWRLPESLKVCFLLLSVCLHVCLCVHVCLFQLGCGRCQTAGPQNLEAARIPQGLLPVTLCLLADHTHTRHTNAL